MGICSSLTDNLIVSHCDRSKKSKRNITSCISGTPTSSTTNTDRHDIAEILLKVVLNTKNQSYNQSINQYLLWKLIEAKSQKGILLPVFLSLKKPKSIINVTVVL
jgi:hypothetical protein